MPGQPKGFTSNSSTGVLSLNFPHGIIFFLQFSSSMTILTQRYLASKGKVASELKAEEVKEEEKNFLKDSYPGLMGSPVQVTMILHIPTIESIFAGCDSYDQF